MVIGIVTEVAMFYNSDLASPPDSIKIAIRLATAGNNCMRPIVITMLAAILALLPLAMGMGAGSEMLLPLAIAIASELLGQIPLVLIILPTILF